MIKVTMKRKRRIIQIIALVILLLPIWFTDVFWYGTYISADLAGLKLTDPLTTLEITFASKSIWLPLIISAIPLVLVAMIFGRIFCSYICPLNFLLELIPIKKKKNLKTRTLPILSLGIMLILSLVLSIPVFNTVSPIFAFMRMMLFGVGIEIVLLGMVVVAAIIWGQKIWCRTLCPLGAIYGLLGYRRRLVLNIDESKCVHCKKCDKACTMGTMPGRSNFEDACLCTNCGDCIDVCDKGAISYGLKGFKNQKR